MKVGIVTSGNENLALFTFLTHHDHEYIVYYDFLHGPYGDKGFDQSLVFVKKGVEYLTKQGAEIIIVPPIYELALLQKKSSSTILPFFTTYLLEHCFAHSLVGKLGLIGDFADMEKAQSFVQSLEKQYSLNPHQKSIRKFHFPFAYRCKEVPLRKYYLQELSYSNILVNKIIKFDLRYFKDAMVDTIIPFNYGYFHYQKTISKFLNFKKIRFHKLEVLEKIFQKLVKPGNSKYSLTVVYTGHPEFLKREKRLIRLLQRGKSIEIERKKI